MTRQFEKWVSKQEISLEELRKALDEVVSGNYEAALGGHIYKKRIRFENASKSGSGRTIICYKQDNNAIFIHGFSKNEKDSLGRTELAALKYLAKVLLSMTQEQVVAAVETGKFKEL